MIAANYSEFRKELKSYLDSVELNNETLIIKRGSGKGAVLISLEEYNGNFTPAEFKKERSKTLWIN